MAFEFSGVFIRSKEPVDVPLDFGFEHRQMQLPFYGLAIRMRQCSRPKIDSSEVIQAIQPIIKTHSDWLYIEYCTWAGDIDSIRGFGKNCGVDIDLLDDCNWKTTKKSYLNLMYKFDLSETDALNFPPFVRKFWLN